MMKKISISLILLFAIATDTLAQSGDDFLRSTGKMYAVVGVVLALFIGLVLYLINLDKKIKKLENQVNDEQ